MKPGDEAALKPWQLVALGIVLGLLASAAILLVVTQPAGHPIEILPAPTPAPIVVDVSGEVNAPGIYPLPQNARVADAIEAAGGLRSESDTSRINLAARVKDGDKVWVPKIGDSSVVSLDSSTRSTGILININTASAKEIEALPGIGEVKAGQIVSYRDEHGLFTNIEDLMNIPGIGPELFEKIRFLITLSE